MVLLAYRSVWIVYALIYHVSLLWASRTQKSHLSADKRQPGCAGVVSLQSIYGSIC